MSDSEGNQEEYDEEEEVEIANEEAESDAIEGEEDGKETQIEEQPQISIERVPIHILCNFLANRRPNCCHIHFL
jgi:hypothetical protein